MTFGRLFQTNDNRLVRARALSDVSPSRTVETIHSLIWLQGVETTVGAAEETRLAPEESETHVVQGILRMAVPDRVTENVFPLVDPVERILGIVMIQVSPYGHLNIRHEFVGLANQAIVD